MKNKGTDPNVVQLPCSLFSSLVFVYIDYIFPNLQQIIWHILHGLPLLNAICYRSIEHTSDIYHCGGESNGLRGPIQGRKNFNNYLLKGGNGYEES